MAQESGTRIPMASGHVNSRAHRALSEDREAARSVATLGRSRRGADRGVLDPRGEDAHPAAHRRAQHRLTVHLPLIIPPGCTFRVGDQKRPWALGKAIVFDDSIEHEVWNESDVPRAVLIFDIWSPFLTPAERDLVSVVTSGVGEYYGTSLA